MRGMTAPISGCPRSAAEAGPLGVVRAAAAGTILRGRNDAPDVSVRETGMAKSRASSAATAW